MKEDDLNQPDLFADPKACIDEVTIDNIVRLQPRFEMVYPRLFDKRPVVRFIEVPGRYIPLDGSTNTITPVRFDVIDENEKLTQVDSDFLSDLALYIRGKRAIPSQGQFGLQSGTRSGLLLIDGQLLRIKGAANPRGTQQTLFSRAGGVLNSCIESFVEREIKTIEELKMLKPGVLAYDVKGVIEFEQTYRGNKLMAPVFKCKGDTRLDVIINTLSIAEFFASRCGIRTPFAKEILKFEELAFELGQIAGLRYIEFESCGIPWSRKGSPTNAHIGNMVMYQNQDIIDIGLVDFDASGINLGENRRRGIRTCETKSIFSSLKNGQHNVSPSIQSSLYGRLGLGKRVHTAFKHGFKVGYTSSKVDYEFEPLEFTDAPFVSRVIALAFAMEHHSHAFHEMATLGVFQYNFPVFFSLDDVSAGKTTHQLNELAFSDHRSYELYKACMNPNKRKQKVFSLSM